MSRFGGRRPAPPESDPPAIRKLLLASEGRAIPEAAIERSAELARSYGAEVYVFSLARIWGTSLGLPMPGLLPSKQEWDEQNSLVTRAVKELRKRGVQAHGRVVGTRKGAKRIVGEAARLECDAIVMAADPPRNRIVADFMWSQEPYRVRRRAGVPVYLVEDDGK